MESLEQIVERCVICASEAFASLAERGINGPFGVKIGPCGTSSDTSPTTKPTSRHEEAFDGSFWIIETLALVLGIWILLTKRIARMDTVSHHRILLGDGQFAA